MGVLRSLESKLAGVVEGSFSRAFRSPVRAVEIARKLAREMEERKTVSLSRVYVPNEFAVFLSRDDRRAISDYEDALTRELCTYLLEHARRERLVMLARPSVQFRTDRRLRLGEFGIAARAVSPQVEQPQEAPDRGHTMVYDSARVRETVGAQVEPRGAVLVVGGKRMIVGPNGAVIGRSRQCDIVLPDENVSRTHAELRPARGGWLVNDLGSTNGVLVNGARISGPHPLDHGDELTLGMAAVRFELEQ